MIPPSKLTILMITGSLSGSKFVFNAKEIISIGKVRECDIVLADRGVSRKHCNIQASGTRWSIVDLGSTNGTIVNGKLLGKLEDDHKVSPSILLSHGDEIEIGEVSLRIEIEMPQEDHTEILAPRVTRNDGNASTEMLMLGSKKEPLEPAKLKRDSLRDELANKTLGFFSEASDVNRQEATEYRFKLPSLFRNYQLEKLIGLGGMGEVYLAKDVSKPSQNWAIKFLKPKTDQSAMDRARFLREMEITFNMQHRSLIRCVDSGEEESHLFLVMDYCNGGNLTDLLKRSGQLNLRRAVRLMDRLLSGVDHAHQLGIVHRDLKPSNILLHRETGGKYQPKISDFGLAKCFLQAGESGMTVNGSIGGSWAYMPKEQLTNFRFVLPQSDVWSLGAILYECLTLKLPRPIETGIDPIRTILDSKITPIETILTDIHPSIANVIMKSLSREAEDRFKDAGSMRIALIEAAREAGVEI